MSPFPDAQKTVTPCAADESMKALSQLLLSSRKAGPLPPALYDIDRKDFDDLVELAKTNHVIVRGLAIVAATMIDARDTVRAEWVESELAAERSRIAQAVECLHLVCAAFDGEGFDATVIKSLDHWPDLGSDLDLYTNAPPRQVCALMRKRFGAETAPRSWGDRLACKWNFKVPGLPELVEIHMGRLGQTGEQVAMATNLPRRARSVEIDKREFRVPSPADGIMISTLQRMYRHFFFRLCDIVDTAELAASGILDYGELRYSAQRASIWEGVATYLIIVSDYVLKFRGTDLGLPAFVTEAARFGGDLVHLGGDFLRVPVLPCGARLYGSQLGGLLRRRELHSSARVGLLPWLATAAFVGEKLTGNDKGIW